MFLFLWNGTYCFGAGWSLENRRLDAILGQDKMIFLYNHKPISMHYATINLIVYKPKLTSIKTLKYRLLSRLY